MSQTPDHTTPCPICGTIHQFVPVIGDKSVSCTNCKSKFHMDNQKLLPPPIVGWLRFLGGFTIAAGVSLGVSALLYWAVETITSESFTSESIRIAQPALFLSACNLILFSLVAGSILFALGQLVHNSDIQVRYRIADASRLRATEAQSVTEDDVNTGSESPSD